MFKTSSSRTALEEFSDKVKCNDRLAVQIRCQKIVDWQMIINESISLAMRFSSKLPDVRLRSMDFEKHPFNESINQFHLTITIPYNIILFICVLSI